MEIEFKIKETAQKRLEDKWRGVAEKFAKKCNSERQLEKTLNGFVVQESASIILRADYIQQPEDFDEGFDMIKNGVKYDIKTATVPFRDDIRDNYFPIKKDDLAKTDKYLFCAYIKSDRKVIILSEIDSKDVPLNSIFVREGDPLPYATKKKANKDLYLIKASEGGEISIDITDTRVPECGKVTH